MSPHTGKPRKPSPGRRKARRTGLVLLAAAAVLVLAGGLLVAARWFGSSDSSGPAAAGGPGQVPEMRVSPKTYDLGQVSQAKGIVTVELAVSNAGNGDLIVREMETSCGCTRASLVVNGRAGPWYGMRGHSEWPVGWSARLRPGQQATLRVQYDPDAHGIYRGPIDRIVVIYSNDPRQPQYQVRLTGTQVP